MLNQDATLFTLGNMTLEADSAGHRSTALVNRSGDIEADGNMSIAADQTTNERRYVKFATYTVSASPAPPIRARTCSTPETSRPRVCTTRPTAAPVK